MDVKLYMKLRKLKEGPSLNYKLSKRIRPYRLRNKYNFDFDIDEESFSDKSFFKRNIERKYSKKKNNSEKEVNKNSKNPMEEFAKTRFQIKRVNELNDLSKRKEYHQSDLSLENENQNINSKRSNNNILEKHNYFQSNQFITDRSLKKSNFSKQKNTFESNLNKKLKLDQILLENKLLKKDLKETKKKNKDLIKAKKILKINNLEKANEKYTLDSEYIQKEKNYKIEINDLNKKINQLERVILEIQEAIKVDEKIQFKNNQGYEKKIEYQEEKLNKFKKCIYLIKENLKDLIKKNENNRIIYKEQSTLNKDLVIEKNLELEYSLKNIINLLKDFQNN